MYLKLLFSLISLCLVTNLAVAQQSELPSGEPVTVGMRYKISSEILGEDREILVALPVGYESAQIKYPVVYLTEGQWYFAYTADMMTRLASRSAMPPSILVATKMANPGRFRWLEAGTPQADQYLDFVEHDVISFIENNFRTSRHRTLMGWEYGGGFTIHALQMRPYLFDAFIASSPFPVHEQALKLEALKDLSEKEPETKKFLYFGGAEVEGMVRDGIDRLALHLQATAPDALEWQHRIFAGSNMVVDHTTTAYPVFLAGLGTYYGDYRPYRPENIAAFVADGGVAHAKSYYAKRSQRYGSEDAIDSLSVWWLLRKAMEEDDLPIFEEIMAAADVFAKPWNPNWYARYANFLMEKGKEKAGLAMYERTVAIYPESLRAIAGLAGAYNKVGQNDAAKVSYRKAVSLAEEQGSGSLADLKATLQSLQ
ncbi:MAG: hypothetical protein COB37_10820 [Kordiimonadales bacterium]|nr:MAG: hypothetical protein COB37_10820 [Kordiimonadales bacterium]